MSAWRLLDEDRKLRRPAGSPEAAAGFDLRGSRLAGSRGLLTLRGARITLEQTLTIADRLATEAGLTLDP